MAVSRINWATLAGVLALMLTLASVIAWGMHLMAVDEPVPPAAKPVISAAAAVTPQTGTPLSALFNAPGATASLASEAEGVRLHGVVVDKSGVGVALISVDGAPPVRLRAGGVVREGLKLREIQAKQIVLERGGQTVTIALAGRQTAVPAVGSAAGALSGANTPAAPAAVR